MRWLRMGVVLGCVVKVIVLGAWWWTSVARAERAAPAAETGVAPDLFARSRGFRELLEAVRARGEELDRREQVMSAREAGLRALEQALADQTARIESARRETSAEPACGVVVTKVYANMRPEEAAAIIDRLDDETARTIFGCMKEKQIGAILAAMRPERAV